MLKKLNTITDDYVIEVTEPDTGKNFIISVGDLKLYISKEVKKAIPKTTRKTTTQGKSKNAKTK
jgi:hypothetical protein